MSADNEMLTLRYIPLSQVRRWNNNRKKHDLGGIMESIRLHGFKDPPKYEPMLNDGAGGIAVGNGRDEALEAMKLAAVNAGTFDKPPRGIAVAEDKTDWLVPVLFGVDAPSQAAAESYGVDHNNLTMMGGDFGLTDILKMWDQSDGGFSAMLEGLAESGFTPVSFDGNAIDTILSNDVRLMPEGEAFGKLPNEDRAPFQQMTFTLHDSQVEEVNRAIKLASGELDDEPKINENHNGNALARICREYNSNHANG